MGEGPQRQSSATHPFISFAPPTAALRMNKFFGCGKRLSNGNSLASLFPTRHLTPLSSEEQWTSVRHLGHLSPSTPAVAELQTAAPASALRKELGFTDLVLASYFSSSSLIFFGSRGKAGPAHVVLWLLAIALFFLPQALVVSFLNNASMEGGLYRMGPHAFGGRHRLLVALNLWMYVSSTSPRSASSPPTTQPTPWIGRRRGRRHRGFFWPHQSPSSAD